MVSSCYPTRQIQWIFPTPLPRRIVLPARLRLEGAGGLEGDVGPVQFDLAVGSGQGNAVLRGEVDFIVDAEDLEALVGAEVEGAGVGLE